MDGNWQPIFFLMLSLRSYEVRYRLFRNATSCDFSSSVKFI